MVLMVLPDSILHLTQVMSLWLSSPLPPLPPSMGIWEARIVSGEKSAHFLRKVLGTLAECE